MSRWDYLLDPPPEEGPPPLDWEEEPEMGADGRDRMLAVLEGAAWDRGVELGTYNVLRFGPGRIWR
jgi:hypothetical protein